MNRRTGLSHTLDALEHEYSILGRELRGTGDAHIQNASLVTMKVCLDDIHKHAARIAALAGAEAGSLAEYLNRHAVAAE